MISLQTKEKFGTMSIVLAASFLGAMFLGTFVFCQMNSFLEKKSRAKKEQRLKERAHQQRVHVLQFPPLPQTTRPPARNVAARIIDEDERDSDDESKQEGSEEEEERREEGNEQPSLASSSLETASAAAGASRTRRLWSRVRGLKHGLFLFASSLGAPSASSSDSSESSSEEDALNKDRENREDGDHGRASTEKDRGEGEGEEKLDGGEVLGSVRSSDELSWASLSIGSDWDYEEEEQELAGDQGDQEDHMGRGEEEELDEDASLALSFSSVGSDFSEEENS
jgi:hypothetical protein